MTRAHRHLFVIANYWLTERASSVLHAPIVS